MTRTFRSSRTFVAGDVIEDRILETEYLDAIPVVPDDDELPEIDLTTAVTEIRKLTEP